ncbi:MAG: hypothetical protein ACRD3C_21550 [Vicinamibacterales bacterium]
MALLWTHLDKTTRSPRREQIATLFRIWAPWIRGESYLKGELVSKRVQRVRRNHYQELRAAVQFEREMEAAEHTSIRQMNEAPTM